MHEQQRFGENWIPNGVITPCFAKDSTDWLFNCLAFNNRHIISDVFSGMNNNVLPKIWCRG